MHSALYIWIKAQIFNFGFEISFPLVWLIWCGCWYWSYFQVELKINQNSYLTLCWTNVHKKENILWSCVNWALGRLNLNWSQFCFSFLQDNRKYLTSPKNYDTFPIFCKLQGLLSNPYQICMVQDKKEVDSVQSLNQFLNPTQKWNAIFQPFPYLCSDDFLFWNNST